MKKVTITTIILIAIALAAAIYYSIKNNLNSNDQNHNATSTINVAGKYQGTNFAAVGPLSFTSTGAQDNILLSYKSSDVAGTPTTTVTLQFDEHSMCVTGQTAVPCMAINSLYSQIFKNKKAVVEAIGSEANILVRRMQVLDMDENFFTPKAGIAYIPWSEAVDLIQQCQVTMATQAHSLSVDLELKSADRVTTVEPVIDEIFKVVNQASAACGNIGLAIE